MKHSNISIFVPHNGCPHQCTFCNQKNITGQQIQPTAEDVKFAIETAMSSGVDTRNTEIAFFGGSFTAIDRTYMLELLDATRPYINVFYGIRCSTRPDAIDEDVLSLLKSYNVTSIELGAQSMCDDVLLLNERGHTADDVIRSSIAIKECNISLGLQMMTGLYGSNPEKDLYTAKAIADLCPDTVRVYPTITLNNTELANLFNSGKYVPYSEEETIEVNSKILEYFYQRNINVIRFGLHYSDELVQNHVAGFYHPAFKELCEGEVFYNRILGELINYEKGYYNIYVSKKSLSKAIGQKKININKFSDLGFNVKFIADDKLKDYSFTITKEMR